MLTVIFKHYSPGSFIYSILPFMAFHCPQAGCAIRGCIYPEIFLLYSPSHYHLSGAWETGNMLRIWETQVA